MMDQRVVQKWEYCVEEFTEVDAMTAGLARLGNGGWELVSVVGGNSAESGGHVKSLRRRSEPYRAFFKRPVV